ncbi:hypothetical protein JTB14_008865 [Gonioctena quinquepunctata]|nr:hypothetical protein JTB14_008865 [Gonioctena quinquepunctata]
MYKNGLSQKDNLDLLVEFKNYRNNLNNIIRDAKHNYYKEKLESNRGNTKQLWETVKEACTNKTTQIDIKEIEIDKGKISTNPKEIADKFVEHFTAIGKNLDKKRIRRTENNLNTKYYVPRRNK